MHVPCTPDSLWCTPRSCTRTTKYIVMSLILQCVSCLRLVPLLAVQPSRCENQLEQVCVEIDKTINQTIQNTLNTLERDCETIATLTEEKLEKDR